MRQYIQDLIPTPGEPVQYHLDLGGDLIHLNPLLDRDLCIEHTGAKACVFCGRKVNKLFANGSCYPCFRDLPQNDICIVKPHLCHYETCRNRAWGDAHCMIPTYLYLAKSSGIKVGISRNLPGRWLNQGATEAVPVAFLPDRKTAGELELYLSRRWPDKTNWRQMLRGESTDTDLITARREVIDFMPPKYHCYLLPPPAPAVFSYPGTAVTGKVTSLDLEKGPVTGTLLGMRAKYLIMNTGVFNVPKYAGFEVNITIKPPVGCNCQSAPVPAARFPDR